MPGRKDDACVDGLGIPEHVHGAHGGHVVSAVVHSECVWTWWMRAKKRLVWLYSATQPDDR